jgi:hypothetical protein
MKEWSQNAWNAMMGDGCTGIPDLYMEGPCQRHDRHYTFHTHKDGTPITRFESDVELAKDVWKALPVVPKGSLGKKIALTPIRAFVKVAMPIVVFTGVRIVGWRFWS